MRKLSVKQNVYWVLAASVALAVITLLFPPFYIQVQGNGVGLGHGFYFSQSGTGGRVDTSLLLMIWFAIFSVGALIAGFLVLNSTLSPSKDPD
tara:strand:+ start:8153 stop:8431 length:279 start_codon:yes stop_codon:yes gene_type:complete